MAANKEPTKSASKETTKRVPAKPSDVKAQTQEAKDLRSLTQMMSQKNAPETSKDITAFANDTLKLVAKSQKAESAAFRREATKTLIEFRNFVEQTTKLTESRRAQLLSKIDSASLDTKNATLMMLSVAKTQATNIKKAAGAEAAARKLEAKQFEKSTVEEANKKAKAIDEESKLKSKAIRLEQEEKFKALASERSQKYKDLMAKGKSDTDTAKQKLKQQKDDHKIKIAKDKDDLKTLRENNKNHYANLKQQLQDRIDKQKLALDKDKQDHMAKKAQDQLNLQAQRAASAAQIKKIKTDQSDRYKKKMADGKAYLDQQKLDMKDRTKNRMIRLRQLEADHKVKLKKIIDDATVESVMKKRALKKSLDDADKLKDEKKKNRGEFVGKIKSGVYEANPLLHAVAEIANGLGLGTAAKGYMKKRNAKKTAAKLNKMQHVSTAQAKTPAGNASPANGGPSSPKAAPAGMFAGIGGIISGIQTFFGDIMSGFGSVGKMLLGGAKFLPWIAGAAAIVGGIWKFIEGFNDASSLFGEEVQDSDYMKRIYSGFTNVVGSIIGIFDTVAGWLGFDTDMEGSFRKGAVKLFNSILDTFRYVAGGLAKLLDYIPGMGGAAKSLKEFSEKKSSGEIQPNAGGAGAILNQKTQTVNDLKDQVDVSKSKTGPVQVISDNSVKQTSTTVVQGKMDTRNNEPKYGIDK